MQTLAPTSPAALSYASEMEARIVVVDKVKDTTLISSVEAAKIVGRHAETVRRWCEEGKTFTSAQWVAGRWAIERWEVEEFARNNPGKYRPRRT